MIPLVPLAKLPSHENEFFSWLGIHVTKKEPQVGKLLPVVPWHFSQKRPLSVNDLIVRERQYEVFVERINHPKGELVVMVLPVDSILGHILQGIVHPPHVPLYPEAQTPHVRGP